MAWSAPSTDDVLSELSVAEISALQELLDDADGAKLTDTLARVVAKWRGAIRAGGGTVDADEAKLPLELFDDVVAMARWNYIIAARTAGKVMQTPERREAAKEASEKCKRIAAGKLSVEPPASAPAEVSRAGTWNSENKLVPRGHPIPRPGVQTGGAGRYANPDAPEDET